MSDRSAATEEVRDRFGPTVAELNAAFADLPYFSDEALEKQAAVAALPKDKPLPLELMVGLMQPRFRLVEHEDDQLEMARRFACSLEAECAATAADNERLRKIVMEYRASDCPNCDERKRVNVGLIAENTDLKRRVEALEHGAATAEAVEDAAKAERVTITAWLWEKAGNCDPTNPERSRVYSDAFAWAASAISEHEHHQSRAAVAAPLDLL